jgi:hypothetical protein
MYAKISNHVVFVGNGSTTSAIFLKNVVSFEIDSASRCVRLYSSGITPFFPIFFSSNAKFQTFALSLVEYFQLEKSYFNLE